MPHTFTKTICVGAPMAAPGRGWSGGRPLRAIMDRFWRLAYRLGFRAALLWWRLRRPAYDGAAVAVWLGGRVLAVQRSYRPNLSWPGGGIRPGEAPRDAARRELREELG